MKKFTLYFLIFFAGIIVAIFVMGLIFPNSNTSKMINANNMIATSGTSSAKTFTITEVAQHNIKTDCYLIVNKQVYDVTSYIDQHPGGVRRIVEMCGQESSQAFAAIHSNFAWNLLKDFYIGDISTNQ